MFNKNLLVKIMNEKNFTAYKLWKTSGVAQSTISTILNGINTNPKSDTLEKLAKALGVPVTEFFENKEYRIDDINTSSVIREEQNKYYTNDEDLIKIERARKKMNNEDKENMMKILEAAFGKYFDE